MSFNYLMPKAYTESKTPELEPKLEPCPACGASAELTYTHVKCTKTFDCGVCGPDDDWDGEKWNKMCRNRECNEALASCLKAMTEGKLFAWGESRWNEKLFTYSSVVDDYPKIARKLLKELGLS